jgi:hypothetical protein
MYSGVSSLQFDISSPVTNYWSDFNYIKPFSLVQGSLYTFSLSAKSDRFMWLQVLFYWNNWAGSTYMTVDNVPSFWQNFPVQIVVPATGDYTVR